MSTWELSALSRVEVDEVWKSLGRYGRYQLLQILVLMLAGLTKAYPVLSGVFEENSDIVDNSSVTSDSCRVRIKGYRNDTEESTFVTSSCDGYDFQRPAHVSFVSEWELVCDSAALTQVSQTLVMAGMFVGAFFLSNLADRYGRKRSHVSCHLALLVVSMAMAFMPNYSSFIVFKFLMGVFQMGYVIPLITLLLELLPMEQRASMGLLGALLWSASLMTMAPIGYIMRSYSWRHMQIVFAVPHVVCFLEMFVLDESLRWLVANHRFEDIRRVIHKATKCNQRDPEVVFSTALTKSNALRMTGKNGQVGVGAVPLSSILEIAEDEAETAEGEAEAGEENRESDGMGEEAKEEEEAPVKMHHEGLLDLIKDSDMRFLTLTMLYIWMTNSLTYYCLTLLSSSLAGNFYLNFFLGGLMEVPSNCIMWVALKRIGRKKTIIVFIALAGVSLLAASLVAAFGGGSHTASVTQLVLSMLARFGINGSFNAIWIYTPELFPTNMRNIGVGISSASARVGAMAAPFFKLLADVAIWAPGAILSVSCLLVTFLLTLFPETRHRPLPQTIRDVRKWRQEERKEKAHTVIIS